MIQFWRHRPIKQKLIWITMLASSSALLFTAAAFVTYDMMTYRKALADDLLIRLKVLEINNSAPLAFQDRAHARENLAPLRADPRLVAAAIYDKAGQLFADYRRNSESLLPPYPPKGEGIRFEDDHLDLYLPVLLDHEIIGQIAIRADLTEREARLRSLLLISMGVLIASFAVAFLIASRLQATISRPITELMSVAHRVSEQKDYTVRAVKRGDDEIGLLVDGLNEMFSQIHERDMRLLHYSETLENQVADRTADLSYANNTLRESEEALQRAHNELEQLVETRTAELRQTVERLSREIAERKQTEAALQSSQDQIRQLQKMEAIGQLAGGIAHDFNNILTAILGNAEIARAKIAVDHPSCLNMTKILEAGQRASYVVQQILTFTHQQEFSRMVLALPTVVNEVITLLRATLPAGIELTPSYDTATPNVLADPTQIHQVLMNLCTNAWHALHEQQGHISVELTPITVSHPLHCLHVTLPPGRYARLSVRDTGCGMDSETIERMYDPFFTTKPVGQGTGLGLSVVHGIVQGHNGGIDVESSPGLGTTFHLYFPAVEAPAHESEQAEVVPAPIQGQRCHILYLDDEEMLVDLVRVLFEPLGYRVTGCTRASEALDTIRADPAVFDVVVTDFNMPEMSGLEVAQALSTIRVDLPVVLVSGYLTPAAQSMAFDANIKEILYKPNVLQELEGTLTRLIKMQQAEKIPLSSAPQ